METRTEEKTTLSVDRVLEVAKQQKRLIWLILLELLVMILLLVKTGSETTGPSAFTEAWSSGTLVRGLVSLILGIVCAYFVYKIGRALEISTLWLVVIIILLFVPYIGLGSLLYTNDQATRFLRSAGVSVGLMGAKRKSLKQIREFG